MDKERGVGGGDIEGQTFVVNLNIRDQNLPVNAR